MGLLQVQRRPRPKAAGYRRNVPHSSNSLEPEKALPTGYSFSPSLSPKVVYKALEQFGLAGNTKALIDVVAVLFYRTFGDV